MSLMKSMTLNGQQGTFCLECGKARSMGAWHLTWFIAPQTCAGCGGTIGPLGDVRRPRARKAARA